MFYTKTIKRKINRTKKKVSDFTHSSKPKLLVAGVAAAGIASLYLGPIVLFGVGGAAGLYLFMGNMDTPIDDNGLALLEDWNNYLYERDHFTPTFMSSKDAQLAEVRGEMQRFEYLDGRSYITDSYNEGFILKANEKQEVFNNETRELEVITNVVVISYHDDADEAQEAMRDYHDETLNECWIDENMITRRYDFDNYEAQKYNKELPKL